MTESNLFVQRERERALKQHQDRILNMKPCVNSKLGIVRESISPETKRPIRVRIDKGKLRQIEQQNYRLLMRLRYIHKSYSLYMPKKHVYLQRGDAGRVKKSAKKPDKSEETTHTTNTTNTTNTTETSTSPEIPLVNGEMANRVAAIDLGQKRSTNRC